MACQLCDGLGGRFDEWDASKWIPCPNCRAEAYETHKRECQLCKGKGGWWYGNPEQSWADCPACSSQ